jgi:catechol 2,3-dioxygenase-like lactoylglutathione lyase family enzyme
MNLNQITIPSLNVVCAINFYKELGLKLIVHTHDAYARFECPDGDSTFSIHQVRELPAGSGVLIYFEVDDISATINDFIAKGIQIDEMPKEQSWMWTEARLTDLDGNNIIIYHAGDNRKNPPWRIN